MSGRIAAIPDERRNSFRGVLSQRAFAVPYLAETVSIAGDQLARVALSVLVFDRTGSPWLTATTYALSYLPAILGGWLLGWVGDRFPRRVVMVTADAFRALVFLLMVIPGLPLGVLLGLLSLAVFVGPVFSAALVGSIAASLEPEDFRLGTGLRMTTNQLAQVAGFGVGGVIVMTLHPRPALALDAATFVVSALVLWFLLPREAPRRSAGDHVGRFDRAADTSGATSGAAGPSARLWANPVLRQCAALSALAGFFVVPEGLAVPYGSQTGISTTVVGLLIAAVPLGGAIGALVVATVSRRWHGLTPACWMAVGCGLPLIVTALQPPWPVTFAAWLVSGALAAYQVHAIGTLAAHALDIHRAAVFAQLGAVLLAAQGLGVLLFGALADGIGSARAVASAGGVGSAVALAMLIKARQTMTARSEANRRHSSSADVRTHQASMSVEMQAGK